MKLLRVGLPGKEKPAIIDNEKNFRDLSKVVSDFNPQNLNFDTIEKINQKKLIKLMPAKIGFDENGKITKELISKMINRAKEISKEPNTFFTNQLDNKDVIEGFVPLGEEIIDQLGEDIDAICDTVGTAGTLMGIAKAFKENQTKIIAVEPSSSPILSEGIKGSHNVEGVGLGFIPAIYNPRLVDEVITVEESRARQTSRDLALKEGIFCGTSSGMNVAAAIEVSKKLGPKSKVVAIACDTGLKYLSEGLFDNKKGES